MTSVITSPRNPRVAAAARLQRAAVRHETGLTLIEGPHILQEALATGQSLVEVFCLAEDEQTVALLEGRGHVPVMVTRPVLDRLAPTESPRGPVGVMRIPPSVTRRRDTLALEVADPGNAGTLIRAATAFGLDVFMAPGGVDAWSPKTIRAGAGAHFRGRLVADVAGCGHIATVVRGGVVPEKLGSILDPERSWAVWVGSEAHGLSEERRASAEVKVTIPMPGMTESLNAAVAGSIIAYQLARWRMDPGCHG